MKARILNFVSAAILTMVAANAFASVSADLESLGSNKQVKERAAMLEERLRYGIVQGRAVDRNWRVELGLSYGPAAFGNSYLNTQNAGVQADLHINPRFSLGARYARAFNQLTNEGRDQYDHARASNKSTGSYDQLPQVSYPEEQYMGVINWYMTYGKINFFDMRTVQFDIYSLAGYGQIKVATDYANENLSEWTGTWTAGAGIGFWLAQHLSSRFELRYQSYTDKVYTGDRDVNVVIATFGIGVLL